MFDLSKYDNKYVRIKDIYGETFTGLADYAGRDFLECEYGGDEDGIFIGDFLIYNSQIDSIEETEVHGTAEIRTGRMTLRRFCPEDAEEMYEKFGKDPKMYEYSGWNPYATPEMAEETVRNFIENYDDDHSYSWAMDIDGILVGTIGAYDYRDDQIEVGISVDKGWQGRGLATDALKSVLEYLTDNEGISTITAWCAADNIGSSKAMENAGMKLVRTEKDGLEINGKVYDKLTYEYRKESE